MPLIDFFLNGERRQVESNPDVPLLYVLRTLGTPGPKLGCTAEQCGACRILADGDPIYSCTVPVGDLRGRRLETAAGIDSPVRQALIAANATQCGYCLPGIVVVAEALFRLNPQPSPEEIESALDGQLCRCGSHPRVLRALGAIPDRAPTPLRLESPVNRDSSLPPPLKARPSLDHWIAIEPGRIVAMTGKVELGQGVLTALRLIVAEELDVDVGRVHMVSAETGVTPNEGLTAGSMSLETSGAALRQAAAWARRLMLSAAGRERGVPVDEMTVTDGEITAPGVNQPMDYWRAHAGRFDFDIVEPTPEKSPAHYRLVGRGHHPRLDIEAKAGGGHTFVQDLRCDLHARVIRPPSPHHRLEHLEVDLAAPAELVIDGSFIAVAHPDEYTAAVLASRLRERAVWRREGEIRTDGTLNDHLVRHAIDRDDSAPDVERGGCHRATYSRPFIMHASLAPSAARAKFHGGRLEVLSSSQGIEPLRGSLARVFDMPLEDIAIAHVDGSGCYGHNGADDAALDAALVARALPGREILVQWRREDEHAYEPYGPAMRIELAANISDSGDVLNWRHDVWSFPHGGRPSPTSPGVDLLAAWHLARPFKPSPRRRRVGRGWRDGPQRRAPLPVSVAGGRRPSGRRLALENLLATQPRGADERLRHRVFRGRTRLRGGIDPTEIRRRHLAHDPRALRVLDAVLDLSGGVHGPRGMGIARYKNQQSCVAIIVEAAVSDDATVAVRRVWIAADAGRAVDLDGLVNQLEGGTVQALSWCLKEAVAFDADGVTSVDWNSYPILRFSEIPRIETVILDYPGRGPLGAGEATVGPASAALANAVFAAAGVRVRDLPMTPERLREAASRA